MAQLVVLAMINLVCIVACSSDRCECCSIGWGRKGAFRRGITGKAGQCIAKRLLLGASRGVWRPCRWVDAETMAESFTRGVSGVRFFPSPCPPLAYPGHPQIAPQRAHPRLASPLLQLQALLSGALALFVCMQP